jgi:hypothetical protein
MLRQHVGEGPLLLDGESTPGLVASSTIDAIRLSPMQQSDAFLGQRFHHPDLSDSSIPFNTLAGKSKTQPDTWSFDYVDCAEIYIDPDFDSYIGSVGYAFESRIEEDDDNLGLQDADLAFDDDDSVSSTSSSSVTSVTPGKLPSSGTASTSSLRTVSTDATTVDHDDDDLAHTIATMALHRLTSPCSIGCQPLCPPAALFTDSDLLTRVTDSIDPGTRALNGMDIMVLEHNSNAIAVYTMLRQADSTSLLHYNRTTCLDICAHVDGGAQASTTDCEDLIWCIEWLSEAESLRIRLKVADDNVHHPVARGYVKVPLESGAHQFVRVYYTPSLPVTILSPSAMAKEHGCAGYSSVSFFDG